jgi:DNA-binding NarL/FixJ family response regulator
MLIDRGLSNSEISQRLHIELATVKPGAKHPSQAENAKARSRRGVASQQ